MRAAISYFPVDSGWFYSRAMIWTEATGVVSLGTLGDNEFHRSIATLCADDRKVVGVSGEPPPWGMWDVFLWTEENGMEQLKQLCLDSGAGNYEQMWLTVSLRGMAAGTLRAEVLEEGVHSGYASGVVPSSFRVLRQLLSRLEDEASGRVLPDYLQAPIPEQRLEQARDGLVGAGLIAYEAPLYQVLALEPSAPSPPALRAPSSCATGELRTMREVLRQALGEAS